MRILYRGTHEPFTENGSPWTTETVWGASLELLGHEVIRNDEQTTDWATTLRQSEDVDLFLTTSTHGYAVRWPQRDGFRAIRNMNARGLPTAMVHLDKWHGLGNREAQLRENPQFACRWVFTPDGDHEVDFQRLGITHRWLPAGVYEPECIPGTPRDEWRTDVLFVGNVNYGHAEHADYRKAMLDALRAWFGERVAFWPRDGESGPWGLDYNDLLASVKVTVGDGWQGANRYWSNRVFEVVGRGGFCVHPDLDGLIDLLPEGMGVAYYPAGNWETMCEVIERWVLSEAGRAEAVAKGQPFVREHHSYTQRMGHMLDVMRSEGAWV